MILSREKSLTRRRGGFDEPQENGNRFGCDWVKISDNSTCLAVMSMDPFEFHIIKPVLDMLEMKISTALAIGAVLGGLVGKWLFELVRNNFGNEQMLGMIQAICLTVITTGVFLYVCNKRKCPSMQVTNLAVTILIGIFLGWISAFLGIGGGTSNVAVLYFFFSMDAKKAAKNSLYIIVFSQISSIVSALVTNSVPAFEISHLLCIVTGGIFGALVGAAVFKRIENNGVERILKGLLLIIIIMDLYNAIKYACYYSKQTWYNLYES